MVLYKYAGFWRRLIAYMIDGFILTIIFSVLMIIAGVAFFAGALTSESGQWAATLTDPERMTGLTMGVWLFTTIINMAYFIYFHGATGRTPGKMLLNLQVVTTDGAPIGFGIAFLRSVGYIVSGLIFGLGYIWAAFDRRKQAWHDKIAGTVVIIRVPQDDAAGLFISDGAPRTAVFSGDGGGMPDVSKEDTVAAAAQSDQTAENQKMP